MEAETIMGKSHIVQIIRELMRGRLEITQETDGGRSRITIYADRVIAILAVALLVAAIFK
jgi:hypothetical protein